MIHFVFGFLNDKDNQKQKELTEESSSYESYIKEHDRLEQLRQDSETIWEERTYQLSAGGLSLTFAIFSFLMNREGDKVCFEWPMAVIWGIYTCCLVANYISHRVSISNFSKYIEMLDEEGKGNIDYDDRVLAERYKSGDKLVRSINSITECLLVVNIIFTVIYSIYYFYKL